MSRRDMRAAKAMRRKAAALEQKAETLDAKIARREKSLRNEIMEDRSITRGRCADILDELEIKDPKLIDCGYCDGGIGGRKPDCAMCQGSRRLYMVGDARFPGTGPGYVEAARETVWRHFHNIGE